MGNSFIVTLQNGSNEYFLRGTTWAFSADRAQVFADEDAARAGLATARKFTKPKLFKRATIVRLPAVGEG